MRHSIILAFGLAFGVVFWSCPAKAQGVSATLLSASFTQPKVVAANFGAANFHAAAQPRMPLARALPSRPALAPAASTDPTSKLPKKPSVTQQVYVPPEYSHGQSRGSGLIEEVRTPFVSESRVAVVRLWSGRMELNGVESTTHMQSVQLGPPGFANLPPAPDQERLGNATGYDGMSLVFNFGRDTHAARKHKHGIAWD